ncbi:hypothetical protein A3K73_06410 [Candidatus Pacearchaeota archaeon RBG_13_36_9]|nr:MAG: hypothetical protein A3K73_06410 [Candidatus Pacearchaeota archaeon RBG_13_36_9]
MEEKRGSTKVMFGGWYQRTTLHLSEIFEFFVNCKSKLELAPEKLAEYHKNLKLQSVSREYSNLDYIKAVTNESIEIRYYEDGLYLLEIESEDIENSAILLKDYFHEAFEPAINYLFSLGAPTPKILSNLHQEHCIVVRKLDKNHNKFAVPEEFGAVNKKSISREVSLYKTRDYLFIVGLPSKKESIDAIVEMQIFFSEFKEQLHRYLNIHRKVWEGISSIKERRSVRGKEVEFYRAELESYKKTIDLINNRINQMPSYAHTRASLAKRLKIEEELNILLQYKFEDLFNTLAYIKEIWQMTANYVNSAIQILVEIANKKSVSGIRSIQILASIGVVTGLVGYLTRDSLPKFTQVGAIYLGSLALVVLVIDFIIKKYFQHKKYELKFAEIEKKL